MVCMEPFWDSGPTGAQERGLKSWSKVNLDSIEKGLA